MKFTLKSMLETYKNRLIKKNHYIKLVLLQNKYHHQIHIEKLIYNIYNMSYIFVIFVYKSVIYNIYNLNLNIYTSMVEWDI